RVDEYAARPKRQESCSGEVNILRDRPGWEGICRPGGAERIRQERCRPIRRNFRRVEGDKGGRVEGRGAVLVLVVLRQQDVIEHSEPSSNAGLSFAERIPGKSHPRRPVITDRKGHARGRRTGVPRKYQTERSIWIFHRLASRDDHVI